MTSLISGEKVSWHWFACRIDTKRKKNNYFPSHCTNVRNKISAAAAASRRTDSPIKSPLGAVQNTEGLNTNKERAPGKGQMVQGGAIAIAPGVEMSISLADFVPGEMYRVCVTHRDGKERIAATFFAPRLTSNMEIVSAKTDLKDLRFLLDQELQYLTRQVLMGVVLSDRDSPHGMRFEDVFISNELIAYMLLHRIAHCVEDAEGMGQRLLDAGVFEAAVDTPTHSATTLSPST
eukprot:jgi/Bigna1/137641/aug1.40_g12349